MLNDEQARCAYVRLTPYHRQITYSSPLCLSMLIGSFFVANTTTRHDYAESLQWFRTALDEEQRHPRYASRSTLYVISFRAFEHRHLPLSLCHLYYGDLP